MHAPRGSPPWKEGGPASPGHVDADSTAADFVVLFFLCMCRCRQWRRKGKETVRILTLPGRPDGRTDGAQAGRIVSAGRAGDLGSARRSRPAGHLAHCGSVIAIDSPTVRAAQDLGVVSACTLNTRSRISLSALHHLATGRVCAMSLSGVGRVSSVVVVDDSIGVAP